MTTAASLSTSAVVSGTAIAKSSVEVTHAKLSTLVSVLSSYFSKQNIERHSLLQSNMTEHGLPIEVLASVPEIRSLLNCLTEDKLRSNLKDAPAEGNDCTYDTERQLLLQAIRLCSNCSLDNTNSFVKSIPRERTTLILRDLPIEPEWEHKIREAFETTAGSPAKSHILSIQPKLDQWYMCFDTEGSCSATAEWCIFDAPTIEGKPIRARVKPEPTIVRSFFVAPPLAPSMSEAKNTDPVNSSDISTSPAIIAHTNGVHATESSPSWSVLSSSPHHYVTSAQQQFAPSSLQMPQFLLASGFAGATASYNGMMLSPFQHLMSMQMAAHNATQNSGHRKDNVNSAALLTNAPDVVTFSREDLDKIIQSLILEQRQRPPERPTNHHDCIFRSTPATHCYLNEPMPVIYPASPSPLLAAQHHRNSELPSLDLTAVTQSFDPALAHALHHKEHRRQHHSANSHEANLNPNLRIARTHGHAGRVGVNREGLHRRAPENSDTHLGNAPHSSSRIRHVVQAFHPAYVAGAHCANEQAVQGAFTSSHLTSTSLTTSHSQYANAQNSTLSTEANNHSTSSAKPALNTNGSLNKNATTTLLTAAAIVKAAANKPIVNTVRSATTTVATTSERTKTPAASHTKKSAPDTRQVESINPTNKADDHVLQTASSTSSQTLENGEKKQSTHKQQKLSFAAALTSLSSEEAAARAKAHEEAKKKLLAQQEKERCEKGLDKHASETPTDSSIRKGRDQSLSNRDGLQRATDRKNRDLSSSRNGFSNRAVVRRASSDREAENRKLAISDLTDQEHPDDKRADKHNWRRNVGSEEATIRSSDDQSRLVQLQSDRPAVSWAQLAKKSVELTSISSTESTVQDMST